MQSQWVVVVTRIVGGGDEHVVVVVGRRERQCSVNMIAKQTLFVIRHK